VPENGLDRRTFLGAVGGGAVAAANAVGAGSLQSATPAAATSKLTTPIGIQIGSISFVDEGTEKVLDILEEKACVNTLFLATFTYGNGIASRQLPGHPLPDHGPQKYDENFHGGNYATPHMQYYKDTVIKDVKAPDHGKNFDILEHVIPVAKKRGVKVYTWSEDVWSPSVPNVEKIQERDLYGRNARTVCFNNPDHHNFLMGLMEDFTRSYDLDGIMWGSERYGAFGNMVESVHNRNGNDPSRVTCFCNFCQEKARKRGINVQRAFDGFHMLEAWCKACRGGQRPTDGYYTTLWRVLFKYPEILAWETMWNDSVHETYDAIYKLVKGIKPEMKVGWHVWHAHSFSPFFRAQTDVKELSAYSDYLKMTVYHNLGGTRMETYITSTRNTIYGDMPIDEALQFEYRIMNYRERGYPELPYTGLSPDYVYRETKRSAEGAAGTKTEIWPGIDVDISNMDPNFSRCTPPVIKEVTKEAFRGGGKGLVISRKYSEMKLANLAAVGDAIRELKIT
jgi:hypothetical protein